MTKQQVLDKTSELYDYFSKEKKEDLVMKMFHAHTSEPSVDNMMKICMMMIIIDKKELEDE